jgi:hypothetical protein
VAAHVFFDPETVAQMSARGITARRRLLPAGPPAPAAAPRAAGFVLSRGPGQNRGGAAVTHVVDVRAGVTITAGQLRTAARQLPAPSASEPRTAIELAEECARLSRENQRLSDEVGRLRGEIARLSGAAPTSRENERGDLDDSARRFALLELE